MDIVFGIFEQLGANNSLIFQFSIFILLFILSKLFFLGHLQKVIETREVRTTKLEGDAEKKFDHVNKISAEYNAKIKDAKKEAKIKFDESKKKVVSKLDDHFRKEEEQVNDYVESLSKENETDIERSRKDVMSQAEHLSELLVNKISKD